MCELWYEAELKRPPLVTVEVSDARFVERLHQMIMMGLQSDGKAGTEFAETAALLSRLIARRKNSFRRMTGFQNLCKLNAATCRLLRADLPRDLELFCGALPDIVYGENATAALPTKNCLDYVLVRFLSVHHIQRRIHDLSAIAAKYFIELLRANNFIDTNTLLITIIAKLRTLNALLGNRNIDLYHNLLKYRNRFPTTKQKSMLDSKKLPENIEYFELPKLDEEEEKSANIVKSNSSSATIITSVPKVKKRVDIGTELERSKETQKMQQQFKVDQLKTKEDVKRFIKTENQTRKETPQKCITHRIPSHLWAGAQKIFERKLQTGEHKKALSVFLKFLSTNL